jgi:RNA polymerase sigma-70 factor (ECF subfamily)
VEGRPLDETELIERARSGDASAYEELVVAYQGIAFRTAYLMTGEPGDAEDAAQSGFIKAFYALGSFRGGSAFRPWLLKIVTNEAHNKRRSAGRRAGLELRLAEGRPRDDAAPSPEDAVLIHERDEELLAALNTLRDEERAVIAYRYLLDLSEAETAAALGCPTGTVKSRLSRALKRMRSALQGTAFEGEAAVDG